MLGLTNAAAEKKFVQVKYFIYFCRRFARSGERGRKQRKHIINQKNREQ